jgi:putative ABC transport system ATP-binding protein
MGLNPAIVELQDVSKRYQRGDIAVDALRSVSLSLQAGEFVGLSGPSGSGKSTLLNIIGLTDVPTDGRVIFSGDVVDFSHESAILELRRSRVGYIFQYFNLISSLTALENVALMLLLNGSSLRRARARAADALAHLGLGKRLHHLPQQLSGGEMQRVAICRATIHEPALILADEPTGNLDSQSGRVVLDSLNELVESGKTVLMASHNPEALSNCGRVIRLLDGALQ